MARGGDREIIQIQVGQCGNQIGNKFWETIFSEHSLDGSGVPTRRPGADKWENEDRGKIGVYMRESGREKRYIPRAVLVDLDPGTSDVIKQSGLPFEPDDCVFGANAAGNNWAKGHYTEGAELIDEVMDVIRKQAEVTDSFQGFQLCHSLGGGTGSGMGTLILLKLRDSYPDRVMATFSVYPSPKVSDTVVEPYSGVLSTNQLLENSDSTYMIDNEALFNISRNVLKLNAPTYADLNYQISCVMAGATAQFRFPCSLAGDLRTHAIGLVPFPRLHFYLMSRSPLTQRGTVDLNPDLQEIVEQTFSARNFFANVTPDDGKYMFAQLSFRGLEKQDDMDVRALMGRRNQEKSDEFVEWIPNNLTTSQNQHGNNKPKDSKRSCTMVANTTAMKGVFQRLATQFGAMYKRKAFLHWYKSEGMDEMEFQEADRNVRDLISEYHEKQNFVYGGDDEEEDDEE